MKSIFSGVLFLFVLAIAPRVVTADAVKGVVALVPGTMNIVTPGAIRHDEIREIVQATPYYSRDIIETIEAMGYRVYVSTHLGVTSQFKANGESAYRALRARYLAEFPQKDKPLYLIGHSAGGLYALQMASTNTDLPIASVTAIASPLDGCTLGNRIMEETSWGKKIQEWADRFPDGLFDFRGIVDMTNPRIHEFLDQLRLDPDLKLYSAGGSQPDLDSPIEIRNPDYLSPVYVLTSWLIGSASDGLVQGDEAYGTHVKIRRRDNRGTLSFQPLRDITIALDHTEQILDYRIFEILRYDHAEVIRNYQVRYFSELVDRVVR